MGKIEGITGWLRSIDTNKRTLNIEIDSNVIHVISLDGPNRMPEAQTYPYKLGLYEDTDLENLIGRKVRCRLDDGIVVNVELY